MSVKFTKFGAALHEQTQEAIKVRSENSPQNLSWWTDFMLSHYMEIISAVMEIVLAMFSPAEIYELKEALGETDLRNISFKGFKACLPVLVADEKLSKDLYQKVRELPPEKMGALLDIISQHDNRLTKSELRALEKGSR